jgi:ANTH domain
MRFPKSSLLAVITVVLITHTASEKYPNRVKGTAPVTNRRISTKSQPTSRRRAVDDDVQYTTNRRRRIDTDEQDAAEEEDDNNAPYSDQYEDDTDDTIDDEYVQPTRVKKGPTMTNQKGPFKKPAFVQQNKPPPKRRYEEDYEEEDYADDEYARPIRARQPVNRRDVVQKQQQQRRNGPPRGRPGTQGGRVVPYGRQPAGGGAASALTKGWEVLKSSIPDSEAMKVAALSSISALQETTSSLSSNVYRELKGVTSSELEQVMLKATAPDDTPVKGKHVERLVGVTYQISPRYDIYDAVLRKLWSKMTEKDWRTKSKALYILHRFSADGAPEHAPALKSRLRELRRTQDPKRKDKYFNNKQLLAGDNNPKTVKYRSFLSRYAHYVLLRAQCFGGMFDEISTLPKPDKKSKVPPKPITSTSLRKENLEAAVILLKAGLACQLKEGEECENTAIAAERVASDMIGLTTAVAIALNRALKSENLDGLDSELIKKWCEFYSETLLPQTRGLVKKLSPKLDAYGLFLPARMGTTVSSDLIEKGMQLGSLGTEEASPVSLTKDPETEPEDVEHQNGSAKKNEAASSETREGGEEAQDDGAPDDDEYEYEEVDEEEDYEEED